MVNYYKTFLSSSLGAARLFWSQAESSICVGNQKGAVFCPEMKLSVVLPINGKQLWLIFSEEVNLVPTLSSYEEAILTEYYTFILYKGLVIKGLRNSHCDIEKTETEQSFFWFFWDQDAQESFCRLSADVNR